MQINDRTTIWLRVDALNQEQKEKVESAIRETMQRLNRELKVTWQVGTVPDVVIRLVNSDKDTTT